MYYILKLGMLVLSFYHVEFQMLMGPARRLYVVLEARRKSLVADISFRIVYPISEYIEIHLYQDFLSIALLAKVTGIEINTIDF